MSLTRSNRPIEGYFELASPQLIDDNWRQLNFDLASRHNILQDLVMPESGGGYVYRDAHIVGSPSHNRFIYWRAINDILELVEVSTEVVLDGSQVRIRFANSPVVNHINVIEFSDSVVIMVATVTSVHRFYLPHPKAINTSIFQELSTEVLFNPANYYIINGQNPINAQQPICAASWYDKNMLKCALSYPDSSLLIVQFSRNTHHISTVDIKQVGIIGRLWSRMPNLLSKNINECDNAIFNCIAYSHHEINDVLLFTLCKDWRIRVFSTNSRECILTHNMIPQSSFSQSIASHNNPATELPMLKISGSHLVIYLTENKPEFVILSYEYQDGTHILKERETIQTPSWEKLIDFSISDQKIWALANLRETEPVLCYLDLKGSLDDDLQGSELELVWDFVNLVDDLDMPVIKNYVAEIFWRNHFSVKTIQKALVGMAGPSIPKKDTMNELEELALTRISDNNQEEAWTRFYNYCLQNHHTANKCIGLISSTDECIIGIIKRSNPSFICPWLMSVDMVLQGGPYRGIEYSSSLRQIIESLNYVFMDLMSEELSCKFEVSLIDNPSQISNFVEELARNLHNSSKFNLSKLNFNHADLLATGIDLILDQLDITSQAVEYGERVLQDSSSRIKSEHNCLESNSGIIITFELFKRLARARMNLARDLLIYIYLIKTHKEHDKSNDKSNDKFLHNLCEDLFMSCKVRRLVDSLRSYAILVWIAETPIKTPTAPRNRDVINFVAEYFKFFKSAADTSDKLSESTVESVLQQNLLMNLLVNGGVKFAGQLNRTNSNQKISSSFYVTDVALNLCQLLWPKAGHLYFPEFLFTSQMESHLAKYLDITNEWLDTCEVDRQFLRASNCLLENSATKSVDLFNRLWMKIDRTNLLGRFLRLEPPVSPETETQVAVSPTLIYEYYSKLTQLFQLENKKESLVMLINNCMSLLDSNASTEQQHWTNCFRGKLFLYYLELEEPDEAYHTMVLINDQSLRINCLRKFIVNHCEKEQWSNLLSYPFIDIKNDFIDILNQKAESSDLSKLNGNEFYRTSYYDLLFASYVSDEEFRLAASVMYNYAQRLAHEVPGLISIRKQADCLLIALNALRCVKDTEAFIDSGANYLKEDGRTSVLKRAYIDCESESSIKTENPELNLKSARVCCKDIEMKYVLTKSRLMLLEKDQTANAIALSPLKPEETMSQLVSSSLFSVAMDLALLFKAPMDEILEGLTAKYIFIMRLSTIDIAVHQDLERGLSEIFSSSYSNIETYNYVANSTSGPVDKLWRLIDYYLSKYDGVDHRYTIDINSNTTTTTTVLMRVVANKLLSAGYSIPASLKRMYLQRNTAELLKLLIKYDQLLEAADLTVEMIEKILEPSNSYTFARANPTSDPPPVYLPTHLIILLISYLKEDATIKENVKAGDVLMGKVDNFRRFIKSTS